jgi:hypothetical protein
MHALSNARSHVPEALQPQELFDVLARHRVDYVLIGGLAATLHGSSALTNDADICPDPSPENRERLAAALRDMRARVRTEADPDGVPFSVDADFLRRTQLVNLTTRFGDFDIAFQPAGSQGYEDLVRRAVELDIDGTFVRVASLADIIRSKETANRPKDRATLPILYALEDEIAKRAGQ